MTKVLSLSAQENRPQKMSDSPSGRGYTHRTDCGQEPLTHKMNLHFSHSYDLCDSWLKMCFHGEVYSEHSPNGFYLDGLGKI